VRGFVLRAGPLVESLRQLSDQGLALDDSDRLAGQPQPLGLQRAGLRPGDVDSLLFASARTDLSEPSTSAVTASQLGLRSPALLSKNAGNTLINSSTAASAGPRNLFTVFLLCRTAGQPAKAPVMIMDP